MRIKIALLSSSLLIAALVTAVSCTKSNSSTTAASSTGSYQGAGSRWTTNFLSDNTFEIKKYATATATAADLTVNGTFTDLTSGFRKLTVTSASGSGAPAAGSAAYGIEVPGFAFFLKPVDSGDSEPIIMVNSGSCPTSNFNGNWIAGDFENGNNTDDTQDAFGTASFTINGASSSAVVTRRTFVTGGTLTNSSLSFNSTNCSGGVLDAGGGVSKYLTTAGAALVHTSASKIFAAPAGSSDVTQSAIADTYSGIAFDSSGSVGSKQTPIKIVIPTAGTTGTGTEITDITTDATSSNAVRLTTFSAITGSNGLFRVVAVQGTDTGALNCAFFTYNSKKVIGCNGYFKADTGDADGDSFTAEKRPFFFLARSR